MTSRGKLRPIASQRDFNTHTPIEQMNIATAHPEEGRIPEEREILLAREGSQERPILQGPITLMSPNTNDLRS